MPVKILIVDDSALMRRILTDIVNDISGLEVAGTARNGLDALEAIPRIKPDVITLDVEMPKLNGIETLKRIKSNYGLPVIMLSSMSGRDITIEALQIGAEDFIVKPAKLMSNTEEFKIQLQGKIRSIFRERPVKNSTRRHDKLHSGLLSKDVDAVVIGASTGGPKALTYIINRLPEKIDVPVFVVQHMPKGFTTSFAARLDAESRVRVVEAHDNAFVLPGRVYIAPGDYHMVVKNNRIKLLTGEKLHGVRPAVDYLFDSAADVYREKLLGVILTGMGKDGTQGMLKIKRAGGFNIAQSQDTCVVYGMPKSAVNSGAVDEVMTLEEISVNLNNLIMEK